MVLRCAARLPNFIISMYAWPIRAEPTGVLADEFHLRAVPNFIISMYAWPIRAEPRCLGRRISRPNCTEFHRFRLDFVEITVWPTNLQNVSRVRQSVKVRSVHTVLPLTNCTPPPTKCTGRLCTCEIWPKQLEKVIFSPEKRVLIGHRGTFAERKKNMRIFEDLTPTPKFPFDQSFGKDWVSFEIQLNFGHYHTLLR